MICFVVFLAFLPSDAQTAPPASNGKVIFSRSTDENGETKTTAAPAVVEPTIQIADAPTAEDADRQAVAFTAFDLDVHLRPAAQQIAVRAQLAVRNDGKRPLARIPLQISSSLTWEGIRIDGKSVAFSVATLNSDADHTGQLHEAAVSLAQPLGPGATLQLDATYSGPIAVNAQRLLAVGAPADVAPHSDWDEISVPFTGLRGFGNVVWVPAASVPVILGDGARLFDEIGAQKLRLSGAHFRLRLTVEFPHGQAPTVAVVNGHSIPLTVTESNALDSAQEVASVATASLDNSTLGFETPSLFVAIRTPHPGQNLTAWTLAEDNVAVESWKTAAVDVTPFVQSWLGMKPRSQLVLLDLPDAQDAPFETGAFLAAPVRDGKAPGQLSAVVLHALTHAWLTAPNPRPAWLDEGVASFLSSLWIERRHGRDQALSSLEADRTALALAEPPSPGESAGQPLAEAIAPVYYRTKAAYVLWMLRDLVGDPELSAALQASPGDFEKQLVNSANHPGLAWFFADWIDTDKGLPDLTIEGAFPTTASAGNWLVAVNIANSGTVQADVPVTVTSQADGATGVDAHSVTHRVRVPARGKVTERILVQGKPTQVQVNDGTVPETQSSVHILSFDGTNSTSQPAP
jgi:hypothetical protein